MKKMKRHLTKEEEFDILKLVLDKFLWMGIFIMGFGLYRIITAVTGLWENLLILFSGVVLMLLFSWILIREFNFMK